VLEPVISCEAFRRNWARLIREDRDRAYLREGRPRVKYLDYDWSLNEAK
jgi:hypothetical protein